MHTLVTYFKDRHVIAVLTFDKALQYACAKTLEHYTGYTFNEHNTLKVDTYRNLLKRGVKLDMKQWVADVYFQFTSKRVPLDFRDITATFEEHPADDHHKQKSVYVPQTGSK